MTDYLAIPLARVEGDTFLHRLHPVPKLLWATGVVAVAFATRNPAVLGAVFLCSLVFVTWARAWSGYGRLILALLPITLPLIVFQSLAPAFPQPWIPVARLGPFTIYQEGLYSGISMLSRVWAGANFAALFVLTTHPSDLFLALQRLGVPHELNFMATVSLQLIPIVQREFSLVLSAQRSRGMKASGFAAALPSFVPVFAGTIERVQQLAMSLEARGFGSSGNKTSLREVKASGKDYAAGGLAVVLTALLMAFVLHFRRQLDWSETPFMPDWLAVSLVVGSALAFLMMTAFLLHRASRS